MATRYASPARCSELPERDLIAALISRDECALLLARIAAMPSPRATARALFGLLARLATPACTWLEGELAVELFEEEGGTKVRVLSESGGFRERVLPIAILAQPLAELTASIANRGELAGLLRIEHVSARCVLLLASEENAPQSADFDISETSLAWATGPASTPEDVDAGWDA
jgi:hypothetical protein